VTLKRIIFRASYPVFSAAMLIPAVRRLFEKASPVLAPLVTPYYLRWYGQKVGYKSAEYQRYQAKYWDTVGQWRWAVTLDYSDTMETLSRYRDQSDTTLTELGCGKGTMLREIHENFPAIALTGVDAASRMCQEAGKLVPSASIINRAYGPDLQLKPADVVVARSTLTYVDESDVNKVLEWIVSITKRLLIISDISGINDDKLVSKGLLKIEKLTGGVYKRLHDHSHVRDYSSYPVLREMKLIETRLERANGQGNRQWIFAVRDKSEGSRSS
jgi:SAM-dependent methyltransferase